VCRRFLGLAAVALALTVWPGAAGAAGPANVTVRVEGDTNTLVPRTALTTTTIPVRKDSDPSHTCTGTSAAGALEQATGGDWSGAWNNGLGYEVDVVRGESHLFASGEYYGFFVNDVLASTGICGAELQTGDSVLIAPVAGSAMSFGVLILSGVPATATPGQPFTVTVTRSTSDFNGPVSRDPVAGATISGGGATVTTGADGKAQVTLSTAGATGLRATNAGDIRSATEPVCVTTGSDGACGTTAASSCQTTGDDGNCGTKDKRAPRGKIVSIREGQRFGKGKGPRKLSGIVTPDPSGIADVRLRLTRNDRTHCQTFDGRSERLVKLSRCGAKRGKWFSVGDREQWSYLLPAKLGPGRYVLDLQVRDKAGNVDTLLQRTRTRVVFTVS
jgi:hypothetical protein